MLTTANNSKREEIICNYRVYVPQHELWRIMWKSRAKQTNANANMNDEFSWIVHLRNDFESFGIATNQKLRKLFAFFVVLYFFYRSVWLILYFVECACVCMGTLCIHRTSNFTRWTVSMEDMAILSDFNCSSAAVVVVVIVSIHPYVVGKIKMRTETRHDWTFGPTTNNRHYHHHQHHHWKKTKNSTHSRRISHQNNCSKCLLYDAVPHTYLLYKSGTLVKYLILRKKARRRRKIKVHKKSLLRFMCNFGVLFHYERGPHPNNFSANSEKGLLMISNRMWGNDDLMQWQHSFPSRNALIIHYIIPPRKEQQQNPWQQWPSHI